MIINHNPDAMVAHRNLMYRQVRIAQSAQRISSGKRINTAADDPVGLIKSQRLEAQVRQLGVLTRARERQLDTLRTQEAELGARQNLLTRMRELAVQASGDTLSMDEKNAVAAEFSGLLEELLSELGSQTGMEVHVMQDGPLAGELLFKSGDRCYYGGQWQTADKLPQGEGEGSSGQTLSLMDEWLKTTSRQRGDMGARMSRLSEQIDRLMQSELDAMDAKSRIEDADLAQEMIEYTKSNIIAQAATYTLAQANARPKAVLALLGAG